MNPIHARKNLLSDTYCLDVLPSCCLEECIKKKYFGNGKESNLWKCETWERKRFLSMVDLNSKPKCASSSQILTLNIIAIWLFSVSALLVLGTFSSLEGYRLQLNHLLSHVESSWVLFLITHNNSVNELDVIAVCACVCSQISAGKSCLNLFAAMSCGTW